MTISDSKYSGKDLEVFCFVNKGATQPPPALSNTHTDIRIRPSSRPRYHRSPYWTLSNLTTLIFPCPYLARHLQTNRSKHTTSDRLSQGRVFRDSPVTTIPRGLSTPSRRPTTFPPYFPLSPTRVTLSHSRQNSVHECQTRDQIRVRRAENNWARRAKDRRHAQPG